MAHCIVPTAEEILDKEYKVLDKGFVRLVDYLGGDARIVQAARVSYGDGTKSVREDAGLIDYLLRHQHTSPFEQVVLTFHIKMPIFVARQWVRHRTARLNEISGRYSIMRDECYLPASEDIAFQSTDNRQGRMSEPAPLEVRTGIPCRHSRRPPIVNTVPLSIQNWRGNLPVSIYPFQHTRKCIGKSIYTTSFTS